MLLLTLSASSVIAHIKCLITFTTVCMPKKEFMEKGTSSGKHENPCVKTVDSTAAKCDDLSRIGWVRDRCAGSEAAVLGDNLNSLHMIEVWLQCVSAAACSHWYARLDKNEVNLALLQGRHHITLQWEGGKKLSLHFPKHRR